MRATLFLPLMAAFLISACSSSEKGSDPENNIGTDGREQITYTGGEPVERVDLKGGADEIILNAPDDRINITGYFDMGPGNDIITLKQGCYAAYRGGVRIASQPQGEVDCDGSGGNEPITRPHLYGGTGSDTLNMEGGALLSINGEAGRDVVNYKNGRVLGNIELGADIDSVSLDSDDDGVNNRIAGHIDTGEGGDLITLKKGCYAKYDGGAVPGTNPVLRADTVCGSTDREVAAIYGGADADRLTVEGGTLGFIRGRSPAGNASTTDDDEILYRGGTIGALVSSAPDPLVAIDLATGKDSLELSAEDDDGERIIGGVDLGDHEDVLTIVRGCYAKYDGGARPNPFTAADAQGTVDCDGDSGSDTRAILYGGLGADRLTITGSVVVLGSITGDTPTTAPDTTDDDNISFSGGKITGAVELMGGVDRLELDVATTADGGDPIGSHVDMGAGNDILTLRDGCYASYNGDDNSGPVSKAPFDCDGAADTFTSENRPILYGGTGADSLTVSGGMLGAVTGGATTADDISFSGGTIAGAVELMGGADVLELNLATDNLIGSHVDMGANDDKITVLRGCYASYNGGVRGSSASTGGLDCDGDDIIDGDTNDDGVEDASETWINYPVLYGGAGEDEIIITRGTIGPLTGADDEVDIFTLRNAFAGDDTQLIRFVGDCDTATTGDQWICGGSGTSRDKIQYGNSLALTDLIAEANRSGIEDHCYLATANADTCTGVDIGTALTRPGTSSFTSRGAAPFAVGIEQVAVSPELGLWGSLGPALQHFGRAMMADFTTNQAFEGRSLFTAGEHSQSGVFHIKQSRMRGKQTSALSFVGVPGASGRVAYEHDVLLIQQGAGKKITPSLSAQTGMHLMQGQLASAGGGAKFNLDGYGAGAQLSWGSAEGFKADAAMLGAWFDLAFDQDQTAPIEISGTQISVSAGASRALSVGPLTLTPQARLFWQKTRLDEIGLLAFSTAPVMTARAGMVIAAGNHQASLFIAHDDNASAFHSGITQRHRAEDALDLGWQAGFSPAPGLALSGEAQFKKGFETGAESYHGGISLNWKY